MVMLLTLRGTPFLYYGDEIGMPDTDVPADRILDPVGVIHGPRIGRDPERTPMHWTRRARCRVHAPRASSRGCRSATTRRATSQQQRHDPDSMLSLTRDLIGLRDALPDSATARTATLPGTTTRCGRGRAATARWSRCNLGDDPADVPDVDRRDPHLDDPRARRRTGRRHAALDPWEARRRLAPDLSAPCVSYASRLRPGEELGRRASVLTTWSVVDAALGGAVGAVGLPVELVGGVGVGADRELQAAPRPRPAGSRWAGRAAPAGSSPRARCRARCSASSTASWSNSDCGRPRPVSSRPVQWPSTSTCGCEIACTMRFVIVVGVHAQLRVHARDDHVDALEHVVGVVERAVFEDVDLDAGEDPERRELLVELGDDVELLEQPLARQPVGDREAGRVVGEREVLVAEVARLLGHRADRVAAVGPVGVAVQVAAQLRAQRFAVVGAGLAARARAASAGTAASRPRALRR